MGTVYRSIILDWNKTVVAKLMQGMDFGSKDDINQLLYLEIFNYNICYSNMTCK